MRKKAVKAQKQKFSIQLVEDKEETKEEEKKAENPLEFGDSDNVSEQDVKNPPDFYEKKEESDSNDSNQLLQEFHKDKDYNTYEHYEKVDKPLNDSANSSS